MEIELHELDLRYAALRRRDARRERALVASLAESGQQVPVVVVRGETGPFVLVDGYKRVRALQRLHRDTVEAVVWALSELEALLLVRVLRSGEGDSALEQGWWLRELHERFGLALGTLRVAEEQGPPGAAGPTGMVGPAGQQGPSGVAAVVLDAAGTFVGSVLDVPPTIDGVLNPGVVTLVRQVGGRSVWFVAAPTGFVGDMTTLYWESSGCTGTPLLRTMEPTSADELPRANGALPRAPFIPRAFVNPGVTTGYYQIGDVNEHLVGSLDISPIPRHLRIGPWHVHTPEPVLPGSVLPGAVVSPINLPFAEVATFDASLGLIPPFPGGGP